MLLSKAQKALLDMLRRVGTMREEAAQRLLLMAYPHTSWEPIVHQLECLGQIRRLHGLISRTDEERNVPATMEAIDIMLLMAEESVELFQQGTPPFSLTFFKQRLEDHHGTQEYRLWRYDVCPVPPGREALTCALLENIEHKYRLVVFVLEKAEQQERVYIPCEHCFVWKDDGEYHFFKYASKPAKPAKRCQDLKAEKFQKNNPGKRAQQSRPS